MFEWVRGFGRFRSLLAVCVFSVAFVVIFSEGLLAFIGYGNGFWREWFLFLVTCRVGCGEFRIFCFWEYRG